MDRTRPARSGTARRLVLAALLTMLTGCFGGWPSHPRADLRTEKIVRTHSKPEDDGSYENFDEAACRVEVTPSEIVAPVRTQVVLVASVTDPLQMPLEKRRIEWMLGRGGVGELVEVDETGDHRRLRGYKVDNYYGIAFSNTDDHWLTRGTPETGDDLCIAAGQTWAAVTSPIEGDTYVTVYAPSVYNWNCHKAFAVIHWIDAAWTFPPPAVNPAGRSHVFTTHVSRQTDGTPVAGWLVRYTLVDGPPATFESTGTSMVEAPTNRQGDASVTLVPAGSEMGTNRVDVEIIRPANFYGPGSRELVVARGQTAKQWAAPAIALTKTGPAQANLGAEVAYTLEVENPGSVAASGVVVHESIPMGLRYLRSNPEAIVDGNLLTWELGDLGPAESRAIDVVFEASEVGTITNYAEVTAAGDLHAEDRVETQVTAAEITLELAASATTAAVGESVTFDITVKNTGSGPATNVVIHDAFDEGFQFEGRSEKSVELSLGTLGPGEQRTVPLTLRGTLPGELCNRATATAEGGLMANDEACVAFLQPSVSIAKAGPRWRFQDRPAEFNITVTNTGQVPLTNVRVTDQFPSQTQPIEATEGYRLDGNRLTWDLGALAAGESLRLQVVLRCHTIVGEAENVAVVTADGGVRDESRSAFEIRATPAALLLNVSDLEDPVMVGADTTYEVRVTNQGNQPARQVRIVATLPAELRPVTAEVAGNAVAFKVEGDNTVVFEPIAELPQQASVTYTIQAKATQAGTGLFRVTLTSDDLDLPVIEEEPTTVF